MIAMLCIALLLQAVPPAAQPAKGGVIRGRITAADSGRPLRRATVTIRSVAEGGTFRVTASTNGLGQFEAKDVPPGPYSVSVARAGYLPLQFGQRRATERGLTVDVAEGVTVDRIDVALPPAGVLGGRIMDEAGEPYPGVEITILGMRYVNGKRIATPIGGTTTDDLGQYRVAGVAPGTYTIVAISSEMWRNDRQETIGYASTYYPGVSADVAQRITLGASHQRLDLDFALRPSRVVRVRGFVQAEPGAPPPTGVQLAYRFGDAVLTRGFRTARIGADGSFEFPEVTEGVYMLGGSGTFDETVIVRDADVAGVTLVSRRGSTVTGTVVGEDDAPPPFRSAGVRLSILAPTDHALPTVRLVSPETDWSFKMQGLGGTFLFRTLGLPDGWALGAVKIGDRDITDTPWDVPTGGKQIDGLKIVVTQKTGKISGTVVDAANKPTPGATVVVYADDEKLWVPGSRFIRFARPGRDGQFSIAALPPGTYRAVARDFVEDGQWEDRAFLEEHRDRGVRIVVGEGATDPVFLKVVTAR